MIAAHCVAGVELMVIMVCSVIVVWLKCRDF